MRVRDLGLGYEGALIDQGVELVADHIKERGGEVWAELTVSRVGEGEITHQRVNLLSITARTTFAKYLSSRTNSIDWPAALETFIGEVLRRHRTSRPTVILGPGTVRVPVPAVLAPILYHGKPTILFAEEGTGKSTLAAAMAVSIASGQSVFVGWEVGPPTGVLILDWEAEEGDWIELIERIAKGARIVAPRIAYRPCGPGLAADIHDIAADITEHAAGVAMLDSAGLAMGRSHEGGDASETTLDLFRALRLLRTTSLLLDHIPKNPGGVSRPYGSMYKAALARATFELRAGEQRDGSQHLGLYNRKLNMGAKLKPTGIRIERDRDGGIRLVPEQIGNDPNLMSALSLTDRITRYLLEESRATVEEIAEAIDADPGSVRVTLNRRKDRFVSFTEEGGRKVWALLAGQWDA